MAGQLARHGANGTDKVMETGLLGEQRETNVTWNEGYGAAQRLKRFMDSKLYDAYVDCRFASWIHEMLPRICRRPRRLPALELRR